MNKIRLLKKSTLVCAFAMVVGVGLLTDGRKLLRYREQYLKENRPPAPAATDGFYASYAVNELKWRQLRARVDHELLAASNQQALADFLKPVAYLEKKSLEAKVCGVNDYVNSNLTYCTDQQQYGVPEYWATPCETLRSRKGDCEDHAILKYALLRALGVPAENMCLAAGDPGTTNLTHAVLVVNTKGPMTPDKENSRDVLFLSEGYKTKVLSRAPFRSYELMSEKDTWVKVGQDWRALQLRVRVLSIAPASEPAPLPAP